MGTETRKSRLDRFDGALKPRAIGLARQARRSGRIVIGVRQTLEAARRGGVAAVLVADDLSSQRRMGMIDRLTAAGIPVYGGLDKDELGSIAGRMAVAALTIEDRNIAAGLRSLCEGDQNEEEERRRG